MRRVRAIRMGWESLNRTSVGLKPKSAGWITGWITGLNRTSVGLKPGIPGRPRTPRTRPQSNQRGIETIQEDEDGRGVGLPQSNQRGIETKH